MMTTTTFSGMQMDSPMSSPAFMFDSIHTEAVMLEYRGSWYEFHGLCEIVEPGEPDYVPYLYKQGTYQIRTISGKVLARVRPQSIFVA